jgi:uncharacterized protein (DUF39 family)
VRPVSRSFEEINEKIRQRKAVVVTAEEIKQIVEDEGPKQALKKVDVVTTATFGPMCSSGAFLSFGHSDPPIRMTKVWLNDVPAYAGIAAVDAYIGATELSETKGLNYGGAHVLQDLIAGKEVTFRATSYGTDCYPLKELRSVITKDTINQAIMFNPRNCYQNYAAAANTSAKTIYTYMGKLLPNLGNVNYATSGELSPLMNDPLYRTIGPGTRIFLGGAVGYVAWEGTQHNPCQTRGENGVPTGGAGTLALIGDLKAMDHRYVRAVVFEKYGVSMIVGVGVPIPLLDEEMVRYVSVRNRDIYTNIFDYSVPSRSRPVLTRVSYEELRSGRVTVRGRSVRTSPLSGLGMAREIAAILKDRIASGTFLLQEPFRSLPLSGKVNVLDARGSDVQHSPCNQVSVHTGGSRDVSRAVPRSTSGAHGSDAHPKASNWSSDKAAALYRGGTGE